MYVADKHFFTFPHKVKTIILRIEPYRAGKAVGPVTLHCRNSRRGGHDMRSTESPACFGKGFKPDVAFTCQTCKPWELVLKPVTHPAPCKHVFLTRLEIRQIHRRVINHAVKKPVNPFGAAACIPVNRLKCEHTLVVAAQPAVILRNRVGTKQTEHRHIDLVFTRLCGDKEILARRIISTLPVTAPKVVTVGADLVAT